MFSVKWQFGNHKVLSYDTNRYPFREFLQELYDCDTLEVLHQKSSDFQKFESGELSRLEDVETDLQKKFYTNIKSEIRFKELYCKLVSDLYQEFFPEDDFLIYQSFPSIRFQYPKNIAVPAHCDSDELGKHPLGEMNFLIPITPMKGTTRLFIESEPKKGDFEGINLDYGDLFFFNGNTCIHYNQENVEGYVRISFDFRVMRKKDYISYIMNTNITQTNPRDLYKERVPVKMYIGGYYQCMFKNQGFAAKIKWVSNPSFILQTRPHFNSMEGPRCEEYFRTGDPFLTEFKETERFEKQLADFIGSKYCFMTTSGSTAILVALLACGIGVGDDVLVPNYTMVATANAVKLIGANPILIDVDPYTNTISLDMIKKNVKPKTKAIVHVSLNNRSKDLESIQAYCKEIGVAFIEDAAQSLGCKLHGKHYGTFGDVGCFSLSTPKIITTGQGGFVVTDRKDLADKILRIKNFGRAAGGVEQYDTFGLNFKFTDIQAVIGQAQLTKLPERVVFMRNLFDQYYKHLDGISGIDMLPPQTDEWIPWFIEVSCKKRDELAFFLKQHNIGSRVTYPSIHTTEPYFELYKDKYDLFPVSNLISSNGLFLPSHTHLTEQQIDYICMMIRVFSLSCL